MSHLDDGRLQAFLDDELPPHERASAAEHVLGCPRCQAAKDELVRAHSVFSEAVAVLDVDVPDGTAPGRERGGLGRVGGPFVKAAGLTLLLAAAASAAVPGSPVRQWIVNTVNRQAAVEDEAAVMEAVEATPPAPAPIPVAVSLAADRATQIALADLQGTTVRLVETDGEFVTVSSVGATTDPVFRTAPGRIEVRDAEGGEVTIELPRSLVAAQVTMNGDVCAEKEAGELFIRVPAETVEGAYIWR